MTAALSRAVALPFASTSGTSAGVPRVLETGWAWTTTGRSSLGAAATEAGIVLRSMAIGMIDAVDPGWLATASMYYGHVLGDAPGTGASLVLRRPERRMTSVGGNAMAPDQVIAEIRATLGLNISETARALGVERPTVYAWLASRGQPQRANVLRLRRVAGIAALWRRRTNLPLGDHVRVPGADGRSIAELLADETLLERELAERLDAFAADLLSPGAKLRRPGVANVHDVASRHGIITRPPAAGDREIDWLTRPSFVDEDD